MTARIASQVPVPPAHARFAARLRFLMERDGLTRSQLAAAVDVSPTMIGYLRYGRYLPSMAVLDRLDAVFGDVFLRRTVTEARTGRCPCGATYDREQSRRRYCSPRCQRTAHLKGGRKFDARQDAIDAMCRGCEPDAICRDDGCALRPFSPFLFVPLHRNVA